MTEIGGWTDKEVYFDNWFSSFTLLKVLKGQSIRATGAIPADLLGKDFKINKKEIRREERGWTQCHYVENGISVISWNDNGPVIIISNVHSDLPHTTMKR